MNNADEWNNSHAGGEKGKITKEGRGNSKVNLKGSGSESQQESFTERIGRERGTGKKNSRAIEHL